MSPWVQHFEGFVTRFPRVSGDEPVRRNPVGPSVSFSPRERG